jgi:predicted nucleotidyltransferase
MKPEILTYIANELKNIFKNGLESIVLFGSSAQGTSNENSDIDLLVIVSDIYDVDVSNLRKFFLLNFERKLDIHIFTKEEVVKNFEDFSPLFVTLLIGKSVLYDKNNFFKNKFEDFVKKMAHQNILYCNRGKIWEIAKIARS